MSVTPATLISGVWNANLGLTAHWMTPAQLFASSANVSKTSSSASSVLDKFVLDVTATATSVPAYTSPSAKNTVSTVIIPSTCFNSYRDLEASFNYLFPYGNAHGGASAIMVGNSTDHSHIAITNNTLVLTSTPITDAERISLAAPSFINYVSGTIYSKQNTTVNIGDVGVDLGGSFFAPTVLGTWPAFWLLATSGWAAELDIAEWNGNGDIAYNTYSLNGWQQYLEPWANKTFHTVDCQIRNINNVDVSITWWQDSVLVGNQTGYGMVGKEFYLTIDFQMEGNSGTPGPTYPTTFQARSIYLNHLTSTSSATSIPGAGSALGVVAHPGTPESVNPGNPNYPAKRSLEAERVFNPLNAKIGTASIKVGKWA